jgi:hypothetical protein
MRAAGGCGQLGHLCDRARLYAPGDPTSACRRRQMLLADKSIWWSDGNPLENIKLIEDPEKNFLVIMKDGVMYKNTLPK